MNDWSRRYLGTLAFGTVIGGWTFYGLALEFGLHRSIGLIVAACVFGLWVALALFR